MVADDPLIALESVTFGYGRHHFVLRKANLTLPRSRRIGIVGANGCGKTTLLHLIVGLLKPSSGRIIIFGAERNHEEHFREVRRRVGLVFQHSDDQLFCPTVLEDVAFGPLNLGKSRDEAKRIAGQTLDSLGLAGFEHRITYKLSGGEKRLVALATVLAMEPEVLLLDEPAAGLDEDAMDRLLAVLRDLPQSMLFASHEPRFLTGLATEIVRLEGGALTPIPGNTP